MKYGNKTVHIAAVTSGVSLCERHARFVQKSPQITVTNAVQRFRRTFRLEASLFADFQAYGTRRRQMWQKCIEILDDSDATTISCSVLRNVETVPENNNRHTNGRQKCTHFTLDQLYARFALKIYHAVLIGSPQVPMFRRR